MSELTSANWSETAASNSAAPPDGAPEGWNPSDANNVVREGMSALKKFFNRISVTLTAGGGTTAYTLAPSVALAAYADEIWSWIMPSTNAVDATQNISGLGARNIQKFTAGAWANVAAGDLPSGAYVAAKYDTGTSKFRIIWNSVVPVQTSGDSTITGNVTLSSTDAGAGAAPTFTLDRNSASPAASDVLGEIPFKGRDSGAGTNTYARAYAVITDPTAASEDGEFRVDTVVAGTEANRWRVGAGAYTAGATGGDKGVDTINANALYIGGTQIYAPTTVTASASASLDFTGLVAGVYLVFFNNIRPATDGADFGVRFSAAASFITTNTYNSQYETAINTSFGGSGTATLANGPYIQVGSADNGIGSNFTGFAVLIIGGATAGGTTINGRVSYIDNGSSSWADAGFGGRNGTASQIDGVRFFHGTGGNITSGSITMQRII